MNEQWQELKETIIEMRDNDGTLTQQEACKFLANLMDVLEKQMSCSENLNKWIPVSERLPEIVEWYLTSIKWDDGTERVIISWFDGMSFKAEVIAWMPLPQPYKAESEDKE